MKVLMTFQGKRLGGASLAMVNLARGLLRSGVEVVGIAGNDAIRGNLALRRAVSEGMRVVVVEGQRLEVRARILFHLLRFLGDEELIYHVHSPREAFFYGGAWVSIGQRTVATFEGDAAYELKIHGDPLRDQVINLLGERVMSRADVLTACSNWLAERLETRLGRELVGIPNPIDIERFSWIGEWSGGKKVVLALARLDVVKGIHVLVKAAARLKGIKDLEFWVAGDGPMRATITGMIQRLGLSGRFKLLGHVESAEMLVKESYIVVMPSLYEPFGMPAAEAGAASRPVVASRIGGLVEIVSDGVNGLLFEAGNEAELAEKIELLTSDERYAIEMGRRGREVSRRFAPEAVARRFIEIYEEVMGK